MGREPTAHEIEQITGYKTGSIEDKLLTIFDGIYQNGLQDGYRGLDYLTYKVDEAIAYTKLLIEDEVRGMIEQNKARSGNTADASLTNPKES